MRTRSTTGNTSPNAAARRNCRLSTRLPFDSGDAALSEWIDHAEWWLSEVAHDPIYELDVLPLVAELVGSPTGRWLDLGCGEGQVSRHLGGDVIGCDISGQLLRLARSAGPVVRCRLPNLSWLKPGAVDGAYAVLVLEHLPDVDLFEALSRVVRPGGSFVLVMNHPAFTADRAGPILDPSDGEFYWRWGNYFIEAKVDMPATPDPVSFFHRPLATILNAAAGSGWVLESLVERGFSPEAIAAQPGYAGQEQMPRLLGVRWLNTQGSGQFCR